MPAAGFLTLLLFLFLSVPAAAQLPDIRDAYGVAVADFDMDGRPDIYLVGFRTLNRLLINEGGGVFRDRSIPAGVGGNLMPQGIRNLELGASAADFDNDGAVDILICGWGESLDLLQNRRDGTFRSVSLKVGLRRDADANMGIWGDLDGDGYLDLLLTNEQGPMRLYRNDHGLRFLPVPLDSAGLVADRGSQGALWADFDLDGDLDLAVAGWKHPLRLYEQVAPFRFRPLAVDVPMREGLRTNAVLPGDIDNDGDLDLLITVRHGPDWLLVNRSDPPRHARSPGEWTYGPLRASFREEAAGRGLTDTLDSYGGAFADFDGDGDADLVLTSRGPVAYYENAGGRFSRRDPLEAGIDIRGSSYNTGFMFADLLPEPGLEMVFASRDSASTVQAGIRPRSRLVEVRLQGVQSNRHAVGAHLSLWEQSRGRPDSTAWRLLRSLQVHGGQGYLSSHVGPQLLAADTGRTLRLRVRFPGGKVVVRKVPAGSGPLLVRESGILATVWAAGTRMAYQSARDAQRRRVFLLSALGLALFLAVMRGTARAMARGIARKQYTRELEEKNAELRQLIEELNRTQRQLIHSEKMAALGQLVAGIAHELNNPIGFIYANLHQVQKYLDRLGPETARGPAGPVLEKVRDALKESREGATRIRDIVQNLWGLSRRGSLDPGKSLQRRTADLNRLLDKSLLVARTSFSKNVTVDKRYGAPPPVSVDETQIQQVFLNILVNAGQALGETGRITLTTGSEDGRVFAAIADDGPGIGGENLDRLFEPFFTTKPVGQGIGLGLHICYEIVKAHGGTITGRSLPGGGAEFLVQLPIGDQP